MTFNVNGIPDELKHFRQWVVWKLEQEDGKDKPTKVPYSPITGKLASAVDRTTWATFGDAVKVADEYSGIGFVLTNDDPYCVIDLDKPADQAQAQRNNEIYYAMASYTEYSPSGTGVHIWTKGKVNKGRNRRPVEIYSQMRFMTVTGNVVWNRPIEYRQDEVTDLWASIAPKTSDTLSTYDGSDPAAYDDQEVLNKASSAKNGQKFISLWNGEYSEWYSSQSEADFALVDILAFYTQNTEQIARLFRHSSLGQRKKAWRDDYLLPTIQKAYDRLPPRIDVDAFKAQAEQWVAKQQALLDEMKEAQQMTAQVLPPSVALPAPTLAAEVEFTNTVPATPYTFPDGMIGQIAEFIYAAAPRPVSELALGAAIGLMAGICGGAYNISGTGLNTYLLLLAPTGTGKEAVSSGIHKLMNTIKPFVPSAPNFIGASEIASPQALIKFIATKQRCFVSIIGECGMWLKQLSDINAPAHFSGLRRILLDLYGKSAAGAVLQPMIYSDSTKNTDPIPQPSVSLLGESTQARFFDIIDEELIAEGFIPRWTIIEYNGNRPALNSAHTSAAPTNELIKGLINLTTFCMQQLESLQVVNVSMSPDAEQAAQAFDRFCDQQVNGTGEEAIRNLWSRAHMKTLKLAGLVAVGCNFSYPEVTLQQFEWARNIITTDVNKMCRRFNSGLLTARVMHAESEQSQAILRCLRNYVKDGAKATDDSYGVKPAMRAVHAVPFTYIQRKLSSMKTFRKDRRGASTAIGVAMKTLVMSGILSEYPEAQAFINFQYRGKIYAISDIDQLMKINLDD